MAQFFFYYYNKWLFFDNHGDNYDNIIYAIPSF